MEKMELYKQAGPVPAGPRGLLRGDVEETADRVNALLSEKRRISPKTA